MKFQNICFHLRDWKALNGYTLPNASFISTSLHAFIIKLDSLHYRQYRHNGRSNITLHDSSVLLCFGSSNQIIWYKPSNPAFSSIFIGYQTIGRFPISKAAFGHFDVSSAKRLPGPAAIIMGWNSMSDNKKTWWTITSKRAE